MKTKYLYTIIALLISLNAISGTIVKEVSVNNISIDGKLFAAYNNSGIPEYYYSDIEQKTGSSKLAKNVHLRIYWDIWGNYLKLALKPNENLVKINNEAFNEKDYEKLHILLNDTKSGIKYYKFDQYSAEKSEQQYYNVDAMSGATVVDASYDCVKGAVKNCYTLYKMVHGEVVSAIVKNTKSSLEKNQAPATLNNITSKVANNQKVSSSFFNTIKDSENNNSVTYVSSVIELARQSHFSNKDFYTWLESCFNKTNNNEQKTIIYNYLIQNDYKTKSIRSFQPDRLLVQ